MAVNIKAIWFSPKLKIVTSAGPISGIVLYTDKYGKETAKIGCSFVDNYSEKDPYDLIYYGADFPIEEAKRLLTNYKRGDDGLISL